MAEIVVNLTLLLLKDEIENVLDSQDGKCYQSAFDLPDLRQELITYVLSRVPNLFQVIEEGEKPSSKYNPLSESTVKQLGIKVVIHQGIHDLLPLPLR